MILRSIGLMSGSSMDGIDAVIMETDGKTVAKQIASLSMSYTPELHLALRVAEKQVRETEGDISGIDDVIKQSTDLHIRIVKDLLKKTGLTSKDIDVIGYHGQNLYHNPAKFITVQIGDGQLLADETEIVVVNNFRENDVKNGGQGAPLAPLYHQALAVQSGIYPVAIVNCGGIANLTIITGEIENDVIGFDTGPGNVLIDRYIRERTNNQEFMDKDGQYGLKGKVDQTVMAALKAGSVRDGYLTMAPPKSLDSSDFILIKELDQLSLEDACSTLEAFTALSIVESLDLINMAPPKTWVLAGGGWYNPVITRNLHEMLQHKIGQDVQIVSADQIGWDSKYMEAEIFAYLAVRSLHKLPLSIPQTTNARTPTLGGRWYTPRGGK